MEKEKRNQNVLLSSFLLLLTVIILSVVVAEKNKVSRYQGTAMDTVISFQLYGTSTENAKNEMMKQLDQLEKKELSWRQEGSFVGRINKDGRLSFASMTPKEEGWIKKMYRLSEDTQGAFDFSVGALTKLWNIEGDHPTVPDEEEIEKAKGDSGYEKLTLDKEGITLLPGVQLDLGAAGKGIACDELASYLEKDKGILAGVIAVGGSLVIYGDKPDGKWRIGIQDPRNATGEILGVYEPEKSCFLSTSGDYEKYFEYNGKRYHHIMDETTGYPAQSDLISVTIIGDDGCVSDALSTACFVMGRNKGMEYAEKSGVKGIFVDQNKKVYLVGIGTEFSLKATGYEMGVTE